MVSLKRINLDAEREGVWVEHPEGFAVKLRPSDAPRVHQRIAKESAALAGRLKDGKPTPEEYDAMMRLVIADEVIADWRGIDEGGYSPELARKLMSDPELRLFQTWVLTEAASQVRYLREGVEAIRGN